MKYVVACGWIVLQPETAYSLFSEGGGVVVPDRELRSPEIVS